MMCKKKMKRELVRVILESEMPRQLKPFNLSHLVYNAHFLENVSTILIRKWNFLRTRFVLG